MGRNESLIGKVLEGRRDKVFLASKFGITMAGVNGDPAYAVEACKASLKRLNVETLDLFYLHRAQPGRPIEETVEAMAGLVKAGKIRHIGLSEVSAATLGAGLRGPSDHRRAERILPLDPRPRGRNSRRLRGPWRRVRAL